MDTPKPLVTQQYPDRFFRALFSEKKRAAELCNVLVGTNYAENDKIEILEVSELMAKYNDNHRSEQRTHLCLRATIHA